MPQAVFKQHDINRGNRLTTAKERAGLQQPQGFFPATV